jgi:hypothetical protein
MVVKVRTALAELQLGQAFDADVRFAEIMVMPSSPEHKGISEDSLGGQFSP